VATLLRFAELAAESESRVQSLIAEAQVPVEVQSHLDELWLSDNEVCAASSLEFEGEAVGESGSAARTAEVLPGEPLAWSLSNTLDTAALIHKYTNNPVPDGAFLSAENTQITDRDSAPVST
jgi:hypothetical protein